MSSKKVMLLFLYACCVVAAQDDGDGGGGVVSLALETRKHQSPPALPQLFVWKQTGREL